MQHKVRAVTEADVDLLFEWSNDPVTRRNSFSSDPIPFEHHQQWLSKLLGDPLQRAYLLVNPEPIGLVRFRIGSAEPCQAELSYSIGPQHRGKRLATPLLRLGIEQLRQDLGAPVALLARVKHDNEPSIRALRQAGFELQPGSAEDLVFFQLCP
jgi:RimJ/RimL family protein N-acetyltransferase